MKICKRSVVWLVILAFAVAGCSSMSSGSKRLDNGKALRSTLRKPVFGKIEKRGYVNAEYRYADFSTVRLLPVSISSSQKLSQRGKEFINLLAWSAEEDVRQAVEGSGLFTDVLEPEDGEARAALTTEILVHIATANNKLTPDPIKRDFISRLYVIFTLTDLENDKVIAKHTGSVKSDWEHAEQSRKDLKRKFLTLAVELQELLEWI